MSTTKLNIGKIPISKGEYQEGTTYQRLNQVTMLGSTYQSKLDDNTSAPAQIGADGAVENINTDKWLCIAVGNVSVARKVVYNNETSRLEAGNVQGAIDELANKKFDKESVVQESGDSEKLVMSQKAVSDKLSDLLMSVKEGLGSFDLSDEEGNVALRLDNGHIKTKEFDSSLVENHILKSKKEAVDE